MSKDLLLIIMICAFIIMSLLMYLLIKVKKLEKLNREFIRLMLVGVLNTIGYYVLFLITNNYMSYLYAHVLSFTTAGFLSYFLTTYYTFKTEPSLNTFIKYPLTFLPNLLFSTVGTYIFVEKFNTNEEFTSIIMLIVAIPLTFLIIKLIYKK